MNLSSSRIEQPFSHFKNGVTVVNKHMGLNSEGDVEKGPSYNFEFVCVTEEERFGRDFKNEECEQFHEPEVTVTLKEDNVDKNSKRSKALKKQKPKVEMIEEIKTEDEIPVDVQFDEVPTCSLCGKTFSHKYHLNRHRRCHELPFSCKDCHRKFTRKSLLVNHERIHAGIKPFKCSYCGRDFRQAGQLRAHIRIHTKEKPYICELCSRAFARSCYLVKHRRTHTGEKPYACICGKSFNQISSLSLHKAKHGKELEEKLKQLPSQYFCKTEDKQTVDGEFHCDECGANFSGKDDLFYHQQRHKVGTI